MSNNASNPAPVDESSNLSSLPTAMNPSNTTNSSTTTPTPAFNADTAPANGAQASSSSAPGRDGSYVPQFSAATEMILRRMRGEPTGEFDPSSSPNVDGWEEAKAKVMMGMKTTMNMDMGPAPQGRRGSSQRAAAANRAAASRAASRNASSTPAPPTAALPATSTSTPVASGSASAAKGAGRSTPTSATRGGRAGRGGAAKGSARSGRAGGKRKRQVKEESESAEESDNMSKLGDDSSDDDGDSITNMPSMTSSGRQISKPKIYHPVAMEGPPRKRVAQKKVQEQALCKRCGRGHSPQSNMIVFCDGCNVGWHQMCHDPFVTDEVVKDESSEWFCAECTAEREKKNPKQPSEAEPIQSPVAQGSGSGSGAVGAVGAVGGVGQEQAAAAVQGQQTFIDQQQQRMGSDSGNGGKTMDEKRAYLSSLPHPHLVAMLLHASTLHPDLNALFAPVGNQNRGMTASAAGSPYRPTSNGQVQHGQGQQQYGGGPVGVNQVGSSTLNTNSRRINVHPQQPFPPSAATGLFSRAEANPAAPINFIRKIPAGGANGGIAGGAGLVTGHGMAPDSIQLLQQQQQAQMYGQQGMLLQPGFQPINGFPQQGNGNQGFRNGNQSVVPGVGAYPQNNNTNLQGSNLSMGMNNNEDLEGDTTDSRESTPASPPYPRPGNGLMRKLPPDDQDLEWLEDNGDYDAFSHVVYDSQGRGEKIEEDGKLVSAAAVGSALPVGAQAVVGMGGV